MPKKKKVISEENVAGDAAPVVDPVEVVAPAEVVVDSPVQPSSLEPVQSVETVRVRALGFFKDGGLAEKFRKEGLKLEWKTGEERTVSKDLYKAMLQSGGRFEVL